MDLPPKQPPESYHSIALQRLADKSAAIERDLCTLRDADISDHAKALAAIGAAIELARIIRALGEYYS